MKKILCFFMVALLAALLVVPCFAAETTVDRGDPVDWFGGGVTGYSCTTTSFTDLMSFLNSNGFTTSSPLALSVGSTARRTDLTDTYAVTSVGKFSTNEIIFRRDGGTLSVGPSDFETATLVVSSLDGLTVGNLVFTPIGSDGFVDSGFSDALTELSTIVSAILSNQYILIAIGLAVAVPLVAWGISKLKSLVKGY